MNPKKKKTSKTSSPTSPRSVEIEKGDINELRHDLAGAGIDVKPSNDKATLEEKLEDAAEEGKVLIWNTVRIPGCGEDYREIKQVDECCIETPLAVVIKEPHRYLSARLKTGQTLFRPDSFIGDDEVKD